jgi:hypothetical protein
MQIFLSYASEDRALTEEVALALTGAGHDVFFDRSSLPAGGDFHSRILVAVGKADLVIFMASAHSLAGGAYTLTELKFAREKWPHPKGRVITVRLPSADFDSMPAYLKSVTVLEPEGNVAAEVVSAVNAIGAVDDGRRRLLIGAVAGGVATLAGAAGLWAVITHRSEPAQNQAKDKQGISLPPLGDPQELLRRLAKVGILTSKEKEMPQWLALDDRRYERLAVACLDLLQGRRLRGRADLDKVMYFYVTKYQKLPGEEALPVAPAIDPRHLRGALVDAYNEYNSPVSRLEDTLKPAGA